MSDEIKTISQMLGAESSFLILFEISLTNLGFPYAAYHMLKAVQAILRHQFERTRNRDFSKIYLYFHSKI